MAARTLPPVTNWFAGQKLTATAMNQIAAWQNFWDDPPMFSMYQSVSQSPASGTATQITMDTSDWDTDSGRANLTPWSYTIPAGMSGRWRFTAAISWQSNATGQRITSIYVNGVQANGALWNVASPSSGNAAIGGTKTIKVNAGDVIAVFGTQNSGIALSTVVAGSQVSFFAGVLESLANP